MAIVDIEIRRYFTNLEELGRLVVGEPFGGTISFPEKAFSNDFFVMPERRTTERYTFATLPRNQIHIVDIDQNDIEFWDIMMCGQIRPLFQSTKAKIATYREGTPEYVTQSERVFAALKNYNEAIRRGPLRSDELEIAAQEALKDLRRK